MSTKSKNASAVISLASRRGEIPTTHDIHVRKEFLGFPMEEISLEDKPGEPDDMCLFTMTLAGLQHFRRLFTAYGFDFDNLRTYGELRAIYEYIVDLACEVSRWAQADDESHFEWYLKRAWQKDQVRTRVLDAIFRNDIAEAQRLYAKHGIPARVIRDYLTAGCSDETPVCLVP